MRALGCLLAASFLLGACASVPLAGPAADSDGKRFDPPPPGQSALYLYRSSVIGSEAVFSLAENQQPIGTLANRTWIRVDVVPGRHVINCSVPSYAPLTQTPAQAATVDLAPREDADISISGSAVVRLHGAAAARIRSHVSGSGQIIQMP